MNAEREESIGHGPGDRLTVDCASCLVRSPAACGDCVVSVLLDVPSAGSEVLDSDELGALGALADSGLLPPLRLVLAVSAPPHLSES